MNACHIGLDMGHCESMICARLPDGSILHLKLDCAGSKKISTALAHFAMPEYFVNTGIPHNPTECTLIGAALAGYETLLHLPSLTPRDLNTQEFELLLEEIHLQQQNSAFSSTYALNGVFPVPVPCDPDELSEEMRAALTDKARSILSNDRTRVLLRRAEFSPVYQYFKTGPAFWGEDCHGKATYRQLMTRFLAQLLRNMRIYNPDMPQCIYQHGPEYRFMLGCPAQQSYLSEENRALYLRMFRDAACYHHYTVDLYPEPMAALLSALHKNPVPLCEGLLVDDHGSLTDDLCCIVARKNKLGALEYCRVKDGSDRVGGHLIESEMLLQVLKSENLKSSDLRPGDRAFALQTLRRWKEEYALGLIPALRDERSLPLRLRDGTLRRAMLSVAKTVAAAVRETHIEQGQSWLTLSESYKKSIWQTLRSYNLPCRHVLLTGGVSNLPDLCRAAEQAYDGALIRKEDEPSLSVADGLCRALSTQELNDFQQAFTPALLKDLTAPFDNVLADALLPHLSHLIVHVATDLFRIGKTCTFAAFKDKVLHLSRSYEPLQSALQTAVTQQADALFAAAKAQAVSLLPATFPAGMPAVSFGADFPELLEKLQNTDVIVSSVLDQTLSSFFFPSLGLSKGRLAALLRMASSGITLSRHIRLGLEKLAYGKTANEQLLCAFLPYIAARITYSHFDVDQ